MNRNLDYRYFPMQRENGLEYVCFTDLKTYERDRILKGQSAEWLEALCRDLANAIQEMGDKLELARCGSSYLVGKPPVVKADHIERPRRRKHCC